MRSTRAGALRTGSLVLVATALAGVGASARQTAESLPSLLVPLPQAAAIQATPGDAIRRAAVVGLRHDLLGTEALAGTEVPRALRLDPFPDVSLVVDLATWERRGPDRIAWQGRVRGRADSQVTFVSVPGAVAGTVRVGDRVYELRPSAGSNYVFAEVDDDARSREAPPFEVPAPRTVGEAAVQLLQFTDSPDQIDVMMVYTPLARAAANGQAAIEALIQLAVENTNLAYQNSAVRQRVRLVHRQEVSYQDSGVLGTDLGRLAAMGDGFLDEVHALRNAHGADLVALVIARDAEVGGRGYLLTTPSTAAESIGFSAQVLNSLSGFTLAHELGHNMGLHHDRVNAGGQGAFPYAYGFQDPPYFRTVMAYPCSGVPCHMVAHFSSPRVAYLGRPTGIPDREDNARALDNTALYVANYRPAVYESPYPSLFSVTPDWSPEAGGIEVTLSGLGFRAGSRVLIGGVESPHVTFVDSRTLRAVVPPGRAGIAEIAVVPLAGNGIVSPQALTFFSDRPARFLTGSRGGPGTIDGAGQSARVDQPLGLAPDGAGGFLFVERAAGLIRRVTAAGVVTTIAGRVDSFRSKDGHVDTATFYLPSQAVADAAGTIYVVDASSVRKIATNGAVTTLATGFSLPSGIALDSAGGVYVADSGNHRICRVSSSGVVTTLAGKKGESGWLDAAGEAARFYWPAGLVVDTNGVVFVADMNNTRIRRVTSDGAVSTLAGGSWGFADGTGSSAQFTYGLNRLALDGAAGLFALDGARLRSVSLSGVVTTVAGRSFSGSLDGPALEATFASLGGLAVFGDSVLLGDSATFRRLQGGQVTTFAGRPPQGGRVDGPAGIARFDSPGQIFAIGGGDVLVVDGAALRTLTPAGVVSTFAATAFGVSDGPAGTGKLYSPIALARVAPGATYVLDCNSVRRLSSDGTISTLAGQPHVAGFADAQGQDARFNFPGGFAVDASGRVYVADTFNQTIRRVDADGRVTTIAGSVGQIGLVDGPGSAARFTYPNRIVGDGAGGFYVAESYAIRRLTPSGAVTTLAGGQFGRSDGRGVAAGFRGISSIALGPDRRLYVLDSGTLRQVTRQGVVTTIPTFAEDDIVTELRPLPSLLKAEHLAVDEEGAVYLSSPRNRSVWRVAAPPDSDGDGLPDAWEVQFGLDPNSGMGDSGAAGDPDGDGRSNIDELADGTNPRGPATMALDKAFLRFGGVTSGATLVSTTSAQLVRLTQSGSGLVTWTATSTQPWLQVSPSSGSGSATVSVSVVPVAGLPSPGSVTASIVVTSAGAGNAIGPITVTLTLKNGTSATPFGNVDTPIDNRTGVTGSVPFTGWALDDIEVARVAVCRAAFGAEIAPVDPNCGGAAQIFVGFAVFIDGARPDVAGSYPAYPASARAGWGFMVLTNMLPSQGNGTYVFHMWAHDREGHAVLLGSRTMTCANVSATLPFGAIDTPEQGGVASGGAYVNFGWALTPLPKTIPTNGSTITVLVDGVAVGTASYNHLRSDIAGLFPGLNNTNGAIGFRVIDTTTLTNGRHTIVWVVSDDQGATEGIGSRFFTVSNGAGALTADAQGEEVQTAHTRTVEREALAPSESLSPGLPLDHTPLVGRRGWDLAAPLRAFPASASGQAIVRSEEVNRVELQLGQGPHAGYLRTSEGLAALPIGSTLDPDTGVFTWAPGVGFVGPYDLVFDRHDGEQAVTRREVRIILAPKGSGSVGPQVVIDTPRSQQDVGQPFTLAGWAADLNATSGTGIGTLHAWAYPLAGGPPVFLGAAAYGGARPDVAAVHGNQFENSGFGLSVQGLSAGNYDLAVFAWSTEQAEFVPAKTVRVTVR